MADIEYDLIVVGGGVLGTFHAYHALRKGLKVALMEKDSAPVRASVLNFGQVVPSGMNTKWQAYGRKSLQIYRDIQAQLDISVRQEGSLYIASDDEEVQLLEELRQINIGNDYSSVLYTKTECLKRCPGLIPDYVKAGLFFPEELTIEPHTMLRRVHHFLKEMGLQLFNNAHVLACDALGNKVSVVLADGRNFITAKTIVCNGSDFKTLYPTLFFASDLEIAKLQMLRTKPQGDYILPGSVLSGLSIRRYEAFAECPSYIKTKAREAMNSLEKKWGVHILFKQAIDGSVILGDSHEYADVAHIDSLGFDLNMEIDDFILAKAKEIIYLPTYEISQRWCGMYSQCKNADIFQTDVDTNIHIVTGIGGKGMTGSAGFTQQHINLLFNI